KKELENSTVVTDEKSTVIEKAPTETKKTTKKKAKKVAKKKKASSYYFTLQLGAFSTVEGATKLKNSIINNNKIDDFPFIDRSGDFFVVRLGRKNTKEELDKIKASLEPALSEVARVKRISAK
ncbi:MAG: SPOR domain-containing protein, partial [Leptospiraceae bacterium]|nr:SPOR domain-containing protein [Leptospiraceae bacterium]